MEVTFIQRLMLDKKNHYNRKHDLVFTIMGKSKDYYNMNNWNQNYLIALDACGLKLSLERTRDYHVLAPSPALNDQYAWSHNSYIVELSDDPFEEPVSRTPTQHRTVDQQKPTDATLKELLQRGIPAIDTRNHRIVTTPYKFRGGVFGSDGTS